jgi:hypothetical protein
MIENDDNPLAGIDLAAWQPPAAAGEHTADAVVARMREPVPALPMDRDERGGRRWWLVAAVLAAVAAAAVIGMRGLQRAPRDGRGSLAATQPSHLDLGASSAELETGADVSWQREGHRLDVAQRRGVATWRIAGDDELMIHAGATVASVEATGASLRVEVDMNLSDARLIGVSAATAAAVSLVTVVVYEGHVKVTGNGQTVNVAPGTTVAVGPNAPPRTVTDDQRAVAGVAPKDPLVPKIADLQRALTLCGRDAVTGTLDVQLAVMPDGTHDTMVFAIKPSDKPAIDACARDAIDKVQFPATHDGGTFPIHVEWTRDCFAFIDRGRNELQQGRDANALRMFESAFACDAGLADDTTNTMAFMAACRSRNEDAAKRYFAYVPTDTRETVSQVCLRNGISLAAPKKLPVALTSDLSGPVLLRLETDILRCADAKFAGTITARAHVDAEGRVGRVTTEPANTVSTCIRTIVQEARFPATQRGGDFSYPFEIRACNSVKLKESGDTKLLQGLDAAALVDYDGAIKCHPEGDVYTKAFMAACRSRNELKARQYYKNLPADKRDSISQICVRNGITF